MRIEVPKSRPSTNLSIKILGVGGAGGNAVNNMIKTQIEGVEFLVANTDVGDLETSQAKTKIQIGPNLCNGLGAGNDPEIGRQAARESEKILKEHLRDTNLLIVSAGMGKGTGTGAAPVICEIAKEMKVLTIAIVTIPFEYEGVIKKQNAENGIKELYKYADTIILIENDKINESYGDFTFYEAYEKADEILVHSAHTISEIVHTTGMVNVDFRDVQKIIERKGFAIVGCAKASGDDRAVEAANAAINNPLLSHVSLENCKGLLINITCGKDFRMSEVKSIIETVTNKTGKQTEIIHGLLLDENLENEINVKIIATGLESRLFPLDKLQKAETNDKEFVQKKVHLETKSLNEQRPQIIEPEKKERRVSYYGTSNENKTSKEEMTLFQRNYLN